MAEKTVRLALIGAGGMANAVHYPSLKEIEGVELIAICDLVEQKRFETAKRFGIPKVYADYREMLDKEACDAVYVLMPPHHLYDITVDVLRRKKHVFIEKPPALTRFQTESLARIARENNCITMTGFNRRHIPVLVHAKNEVESTGRITQVVATFYKRAPAAYYNGAIDALTCDAIHAVDALRWMAGSEAARVACVEGQFDDVVPNSWNAVIQFENGVTGVLLTNWSVTARAHTFEIHGLGASAFVVPEEETRIYKSGERVSVTSEQLTGRKEHHANYGFLDEARHFIACVRSGTQPTSNFDDAAKTMALVERIRQSAI